MNSLPVVVWPQRAHPPLAKLGTIHGREPPGIQQEAKGAMAKIRRTRDVTRAKKRRRLTTCGKTRNPIRSRRTFLQNRFPNPVFVSNYTQCTVKRMVALTTTHILPPHTPRPTSHSGAYNIHRWMLSPSLALRGTPPSSDAIADLLPDLFTTRGMLRMAFSFVLPAFMMKPPARVGYNN
jgi:hypothetical protein